MRRKHILAFRGLFLCLSMWRSDVSDEPLKTLGGASKGGQELDLHLILELIAVLSGRTCYPTSCICEMQSLITSADED